MKKLSDEELSLVLSEHAMGKLRHANWRIGDCGCVAGAVFNVEDWASVVDGTVPSDAIDVSESIERACGADCPSDVQYPAKPEAMLDLLARAGL